MCVGVPTCELSFISAPFAHLTRCSQDILHPFAFLLVSARQKSLFLVSHFLVDATKSMCCFHILRVSLSSCTRLYLLDAMTIRDRWRSDLYFFLDVVALVDVIFEVDIRSPMYFWRNLLLLSSLSCSSLTASIRLKISRSDDWRFFACSFNSSLASRLIFSKS